MAAVTQRIGSYLGGVSKQSDDKKLPGQVRECYNGFPDATYGLTKRPGFEHVLNLGTGTTYDDGKWFFIKRDNDEEYVGVIKGTTIAIWNAVTGATCTVTTPDGTGYLSGTKDDYKIITVQDTSIIINSAVNVTVQAAGSYNLHRNATVEINGVLAQTTYTIEITINNVTQTATYTTSSSADIDTILSDLKTDIEAFTGDHASLTVTKLSGSLEINSPNHAMDVHAEGGLDNTAMHMYEDEVAVVGELAAKSIHDRKVKVQNTNSDRDVYWAKFVAHDGVSGEGYWEETIDPTVSPGLTNSTMPHELVNTATNTFVFKEIDYVNRLVGDDDTNPHPSFVDTTSPTNITAGFFHNNRLGFLSRDNVIMSQSGDFFNFYSKSAKFSIASDPVDISCASIKPTVLHAVLPVAQGVILFSEKQQFVLFADAGVLTPDLATIRAISNYEIDKNIDPVDVGNSINFVSKTPGYSRVFGMVTRGNQENPLVLDISRVVKEWVSPDVDRIISSPQNGMIALSGQDLKELYIFRYYNDGKETLMESWVSWLMPGTVQFTEIIADTMYAVTKQGGQFTLLKTALSQSPEEAIIVNNKGEKVNPCIDLYKAPSSVVWDAANNRTKCYLPYNDDTDLTPVLIIKGDTTGGTFVESGFTITPERDTDGTGTFFIVPNKNLTNTADGDYPPLDVADDVIIGYSYNFDVELPRTYFRPDNRVTDFTANLTLSRMKFAIGLSGVMGFKLKAKGRDEWTDQQPVILANEYLANDVPLDNETVYILPIHQRTENFTLRMFNNSPFPVAINAMMWEGKYTPRFYRRV